MLRLDESYPPRDASHIVSTKRYETHLGKTQKHIDIQQVNKTTSNKKDRTRN